MILRTLALLLAATSIAAPLALTASAQAKLATIPLCPGLQIVTAINQQEGDYESIKTIQTVASDRVRLKFSAERPESDPLAPDYGKVKLHTIYRTILKQDLISANFYAQKYFDNMPETIPESTGIGFSSNVLKALKSSNEPAEFSISNAYDATPGIDKKAAPNIYDFRAIGELKKVAAGPMKVLVNNVLTDLPTITARGEFYGETSEFVILDDPGNPLTLAFRVGIGTVMQPPKPPLDADTLKVTSITFRCPVPAPVAAAPAKPEAGTPVAAAPSPPPSGLAAELAKSQKVAIYDIFFDFNSDKLREESEPRLKEIADVMKANPDWRLSVAGHTDAIASDSFNLDLSRRRAAAVKAALVSRYGIAASRLETTGYGEAQPRDTNATLEGRAHNRRVELQKL